MRLFFSPSICRFVWIFLFSVQFIVYASAQKRFNTRDKDSDKMEALEGWFSLADKEKSFLDSLTRAGHKVWMKADGLVMVTNLLRDEYFVPVFGEPLSAMSAESQKKYGNAIMELAKDKKYRDKWATMDRSYLSFANAMSMGDCSGYKKLLEDLQRKKKNYDLIMKDLSDMNVSLMQIQYKYDETNSFNALLPSEIYKLEWAFTEKRNNTEYISVLNTVQPILNMPASVETIHSIISQRDSRYTEISRLEPAVKNKIVSMLNKRLSENIVLLMQAEESRIRQAGQANNFSSLSEYFRNFRNGYSILLDSPAVKTVYRQWEDTWLQALTSNSPMLENKIKQATGEEELMYLQTKYFSFNGINNPQLGNLRSLLDDRVSFVRRKINDAKQAERDEREKKFYSMPNRLKIDVVNYRDAFRAAYSRNYEKLDEIAKRDINIPRLLFKLLIETISDSCEKYLPAQRIGVPLMGKRYVRTDVTGVYPYQTRTHVYEEYIIKRVYMDAKYGDRYTNTHIVTNSGIDGSDFLHSMLNLDQTIDEMQELIRQGDKMRQDAGLLISKNNCHHPGITDILNNLNYYLDGYSRPKEWEKPDEGFTSKYVFNEKEKYYRDTRLDYVKKHYVDAPAYFVPEIVYPPDSNSSYSEIIVHHAGKPDPGIVSIVCHTMNVNLLGKGKYVNERDPNKYNQPPEIEAEYRKNYKNYYIIEVIYNRYKNGILESNKETFWFDNGSLPSAEFRQFLAEHIKKPVKKLELDHDVSDAAK